MKNKSKKRTAGALVSGLLLIIFLGLLSLGIFVYYQQAIFKYKINTFVEELGLYSAEISAINDS